MRTYNVLKIDFKGFEDSKDAQYVYGVLRRKGRFQSKTITEAILFYDTINASAKMKTIRPALRTMRLMNWIYTTYDIEEKEDLESLLERTSLTLQPEIPDVDGMRKITTLSFSKGQAAEKVYNELSVLSKRDRMHRIIEAVIAYIDHGMDEMEYKRMCEIFLSDLAREYERTGSVDTMYALMKNSRSVVDLITPVDKVNANRKTSLASEIVDYMIGEEG